MGLLVSSAFKEKCLKDKIKNNSYKDSTVWAELQDKKSKERWEEKQTLDQMWEKEHFLCRSFSPWQFNLTNMCVWHMRGRRQRRGEAERVRERERVCILFHWCQCFTEPLTTACRVCVHVCEVTTKRVHMQFKITWHSFEEIWKLTLIYNQFDQWLYSYKFNSGPFFKHDITATCFDLYSLWKYIPIQW